MKTSKIMSIMAMAIMMAVNVSAMDRAFIVGASSARPTADGAHTDFNFDFGCSLVYEIIEIDIIAGSFFAGNDKTVTAEISEGVRLFTIAGISLVPKAGVKRLIIMDSKDATVYMYGAEVRKDLSKDAAIFIYGGEQVSTEKNNDILDAAVIRCGLKLRF